MNTLDPQLLHDHETDIMTGQVEDPYDTLVRVTAMLEQEPDYEPEENVNPEPCTQTS